MEGDDDDDGWGGFEGDGWSDDELEGSQAASAQLVTAPKQTLTKASVYEVLETNKLEEQLDDMVKKMAEILYVSPSEAQCLLKFYSWNQKKLQEEWFQDHEGVRSKAGLSDESVSQETAEVGSKRKSPSSPKKVQCQTAYCDRVSIDDALALPCGHWFCNACWKGFLESQIKGGAQCIHATCMGLRCKQDHPHKFGCACKEIVPKKTFEYFVTDKELLGKYRGWLLDSFVEGHQNIKWCPNPRCDRAIHYPTGGTFDLECKCEQRFCFSCLQEAHNPAPCDLVRKWLLKETSDDATTIWLKARTKECPNCQVRIEKNKACNHMTCVKCKHHFCWLCKGPWSEHGSSTGGYYVCNTYKDDVAKGKHADEEKNMMTSQRLLQKYMHYYKYFKEHGLNVNRTRQLKETLDRKIMDLNLEQLQFQFVLDACDTLVQARRTLQWVYVMAYYMQGGSSKTLLEYQQQNLTEKTERLSQILETNDVKEIQEKKKTDVQALSNAIKNFTSQIQQMVERGDFEEDLLVEADAVMEDWVCAICEKRNQKTDEHCKSCLACRKHGEMDCRACPRDDRHR